MTKRMKTMLVSFVVSCLTFCFLFTSLSFGQEMPKPGQVIDQSNFKKYAHLFPPEFLPYFENGWGIIKPISIKVSETKPSPITKKFLELSEKSRGKFTIDKDGNLIGYDYQSGLPFPGVAKEDKDFIAKLMWNYYYRYRGDEVTQKAISFEQRKGEKHTQWSLDAQWMLYANRLYIAPKPILKTPINLNVSMLFKYFDPPGLRNLMIITYRYLDSKKADEMYLYLPTMRRVLRAEGGQRSTPVQASTQAPDDFFGFDGRTPDFTYEFVGEQKVLGVPDNQMHYKTAQARFSLGANQMRDTGWELRDVYVIDIKPKDPKYPQSKKRIYMDKENMLNIYYAMSWDRAGKLWKVWYLDYRRYPLADGDTVNDMIGLTCVDVQFGLFLSGLIDSYPNVGGYTYTDFTPSTMLKLAR